MKRNVKRDVTPKGRLRVHCIVFTSDSQTKYLMLIQNQL